LKQLLAGEKNEVPKADDRSRHIFNYCN